MNQNVRRWGERALYFVGGCLFTMLLYTLEFGPR